MGRRFPLRWGNNLIVSYVFVHDLSGVFLSTKDGGFIGLVGFDFLVLLLGHRGLLRIFRRCFRVRHRVLCGHQIRVEFYRLLCLGWFV